MLPITQHSRLIDIAMQSPVVSPAIAEGP